MHGVRDRQGVLVIHSPSFDVVGLEGGCHSVLFFKKSLDPTVFVTLN